MKSIWRLYRDVVEILPGRAQRFLLGYAIALALLSLLDGAALALLALAISPLASGGNVSLPVIGDLDTAGMIWLVAVICLLILAKSATAILLLWRTTRTFSSYELELGHRLFSAYIRSPWVERLKRNSADIVRTTDSSVSTTISGFVLPASTLIGEIMTSVTLVSVLAVAQPAVAAITIVYLGALALCLYYMVARRTRQAGLVALRYSLRSSRLITEMVGALKEVTLRDATSAVAEVVRANRRFSTRARANMQFLGQIPRYALDAGIVGGFVLVAAVGFATGGPAGAATAIALFGLAGFRMAPSLVRIQGVFNQLNVSKPHAELVVSQIHASEALAAEATADRKTLELPPHPKSLRFNSVSFRYSPEAPFAVRDVDLSIPFGASVAIVGASGAGKSTVVDLLLGLIEPTSGSIEIDGERLVDYTASWRSRVAYVPQDVSIFDSTIAQNVALTWGDDFDVERVEGALARAQLLDLVETRLGGINGRVGERGLKLSGGQRQRLGIARALYADPLVLVMDEATSALDTATEAAVTEAVRALHGEVTVVMVAHRLATIVHADIVFFFSDGRLVAQGTFAELVERIPEFKAQAALAGLLD